MDDKFRYESQDSKINRLLNMIRDMTVKDDDFENKMLVFEICVELVIKNVGTVREYVYDFYYDVFLKVYDSIVPWLRTYDAFKVKDLDPKNYKAKVTKLIWPKLLVRLLVENCEKLMKYSKEHKHKLNYEKKIYHQKLINLPEDVLRRILSKEGRLNDS